jgi:hypothetical protein
MSDLKFKVSVSTGLFGIAHGEELATVVRKLGYALTRGTCAIEIAGDVPHEIDFSEGKEIRRIAEKQGIDLNFHGSLTIPFEIPEMVQWQEAQDHVYKSIKSAVYGGCKYVDFHACLHFWVDMMTYVGARLENIMCDWDGRFVSDILYDNPKLREYFVKVFWDKYDSLILGEEMRAIYYQVELESQREARETVGKGIASTNGTGKQMISEVADIHVKLLKKKTQEALLKKLGNPDPEGRKWYYLGKLRGDYVDACWIMVHHLLFTQDPVWVEMAKMYRGLLERYNYNFNFNPDNEEDRKWLYDSWLNSQDKGDIEFKEFYYGIVGAKFLMGHLIHTARWMAETQNFKDKGLPTKIEKELKTIRVPDLEKEKKELLDVLKNLHIAIEMPDARDPKEAGRYMLWRTKQIYLAIKLTREALKKEGNPFWDKIMMLIDFEHIATQGVDPLEELRELVKYAPDVGKYIICIHSNNPSPLHSHFPIQLGDDRIYELLWILKKAGLGEDHTTYILFERGGFKDPFQQSVTALRLMVEHMKKNVPPSELPPEFYGVAPRGLLSEERQWVNIFQHAMDPLKGLLKISEEEYTSLSKAAMDEGKRPEEWKKEEYR